MGERTTVTTPERRSGTGVRRRSRVASEPDLQAILADAVERLAQETQATVVAAWGRRRTGEPTVLAASFEGPGPRAPDEAAFRSLTSLEGAVDLGDMGIPDALQEAALPEGLAAAAPVRAQAGEPLVALLIGGPDDPPGNVRPRTLAALDGVARRLRVPVMAAFSRERLAAVDSQVQRLDRLAALGALVAEIVHEIRNPLVSVKTFLQLLPDRGEDPEFKQSFFEVASEELRRIERLLDVVLEHARPGAATHDAETDVRRSLEAVNQLVAHRAAEKQVALSTEMSADLPRVAIVEDALRQVVLNLTLNAIDATPEAGRVRLVAASSESGVEIRVEDTGSGIPESRRAAIFDPFWSGKEGHAGGLGLAISKRIVEEVSGSISVGERPGGGAVFRVWLPTR